MLKGKSLRRAIATSDALRINACVPLIVDATELITPSVAQEMLTKNKRNRPINWSKVEEYASAMRAGMWRLHAQGIVLDTDGNILTGQKRLWAVVVSGQNVYMRVSTGNPPEVARLLDRGTPQTARDLASRETERKHSPSEVSIVRAYCALMGNTRPTVDDIAEHIATHHDALALLMSGMKRIKKTKTVLMVAGAMLARFNNLQIQERIGGVQDMAERLERLLLPHSADTCWNRGAAFGLAMEKAEQALR